MFYILFFPSAILELFLMYQEALQEGRLTVLFIGLMQQHRVFVKGACACLALDKNKTRHNEKRGV